MNSELGTRNSELGHALVEALMAFGQSESERLPVIDLKGSLVGALTKTDLLMFLAGRPKESAVILSEASR